MFAGTFAFLNRALSRRRFRWAFNAFVMLLVALVLVQRVATMQSQTAQLQPAAVQLAEDNFEVSIETLLAASLFGSAPSTSPTDTAAAPPTRLNLVLRGVITIKDSGLAFISVDGKPDEMVAHGREVIPGVTLSVVHRDSVVLTRNGRPETLMLEGAELVAEIETVAGSASPVARALPARQISVDKPFKVSRASLRNQVRSPQELLSQAVLVPNADGGFLLKEVVAGGLIEQFGLQSGDIVRSANGQSLNYADDIRRTYEQLANARHLKLELYRDGKTKELNFEIQ